MNNREYTLQCYTVTFLDTDMEVHTKAFDTYIDAKSFADSVFTAGGYVYRMGAKFSPADSSKFQPSI